MIPIVGSRVIFACHQIIKLALHHLFGIFFPRFRLKSVKLSCDALRTRWHNWRVSVALISSTKQLHLIDSFLKRSRMRRFRFLKIRSRTIIMQLNWLKLDDICVVVDISRSVYFGGAHGRLSSQSLNMSRYFSFNLIEYVWFDGLLAF